VLAPAPAGASSTTTPAPGGVASILKSADASLGSVRQFFLCGTAKCKKERATLMTSAATAMKALLRQAQGATSPHVQTKYRPAMRQFASDVHSLDASYREYFVTTSSVTLSGLTGNVFYLTSDLASDVNVLRAKEQGHPVTFNLWVEGEAATLVAMQTDASALQSSTATVSIGIYANQLLEDAAQEMLAQANGPNASFNTLLKAFAHNQLRISQSEVLFLHNKKAPMTEKQVANLNVTVAAEFAKLIKTETALVKKK
jgi:hypothetical protein